MQTTTSEVKDDILMLIARERNLANLERIRTFIATLAFGGSEEDDWWGELSAEQQNRLTVILQEMKAGKNIVTNDAFWTSLERWKP
jgi:hypothetical protein